MDSRFRWPFGPATPPAPPPPSFVVPRASPASPPSYHDAYPSSYHSGISGQPPTQSDSRPYAPVEYVDPGYYNITPPHQYRLPSTLNSDTSIGPDFNSNPNSNMLNYPESPSDSDASQYPFSPRPKDSDPHTPSTLSEGTGNSTTPPDSGPLMSHQLVPDTSHSKDPGLQQLADAIIKRRRSLGHESVPDLYVAQFFLIKRVPGSTRPVSNRRKRGEKPRPKTMLEYHCLRCGRWDGYSKEKARLHFLTDFDMKGFTCEVPGCKHKTAHGSDFTRHMELVHKVVQPKKKSGGAMRAEKPFLKLQEAYRNGERAFPVDLGQNLSHVSAATNGLTFAAHTHTTTPQLEWIGAFSESSAITGLEQVCLLPRTRYRNRGCKALGYWLRWWHIWATAPAVYSLRIRNPADVVISSVLGATITTVPAHIQNNENSKDITRPFLMNSDKQNPPDHSTHLNLRRALSEPKRRGLNPKCLPKEESPAMFRIAFPFLLKIHPFVDCHDNLGGFQNVRLVIGVLPVKPT